DDGDGDYEASGGAADDFDGYEENYNGASGGDQELLMSSSASETAAAADTAPAKEADQGEGNVDVELDQLFDDNEPRMLPSTYDPDAEDNDFTTYTAAKTSAYEALAWQLHMSNLEGKEREVGEHILGLLDEDGYLRSPVEEI